MLEVGSVVVAGSERQIMRDARRMEAADRRATAEVTLCLRRRSGKSALPTLEDLGRRSIRSRRPLGREEFSALYGADPEDLAAVRVFAQSHGLQVLEESLPRRSVRLGGTVEALTGAFGVDLHRYEFPGGSYRGRIGPVRVPANLKERVLAVVGLDDRPQSKTHFRFRTGRSSGDPSYTPLQVAAAYAFPPGTDGSGQSVGIIELGGGYRAADLAKYFQEMGVPTPTVTAVSVDGAENAPTGDANGPDAEVELDVEMVGALAPGATIAVYFGPNTDQGFLDAVSSAVHDTTHRPTVISISWGGPESSWTAQARAAFQAVFVDAAAMGVTVLIAAGDNGADDGGPGTGLSVDFPASSPGALACGGTRMLLSAGAISQESVWNELASGEGATGGGVSEDFPLPTYQGSSGVPSAPNGFVGRGVPDVAGDADPTTGYQVLVDGALTVIGGTSAVAPLWAALIARLNQELGKPVGYVNPLLYAAGTASAFHDVTSGGNGGYDAGPGWDPCTGLGTPDGTALLQALRAA
jgi:kumamolisin